MLKTLAVIGLAALAAGSCSSAPETAPATSSTATNPDCAAAAATLGLAAIFASPCKSAPASAKPAASPVLAAAPSTAGATGPTPDGVPAPATVYMLMDNRLPGEPNCPVEDWKFGEAAWVPHKAGAYVRVEAWPGELSGSRKDHETSALLGYSSCKGNAYRFGWIGEASVVVEPGENYFRMESWSKYRRLSQAEGRAEIAKRKMAAFVPLAQYAPPKPFKGMAYYGPDPASLTPGTGRLSLPDGGVLVGKFARGAATEGELTYADGSVYSGAFSGTQPSGRGTLRSPDGSTYAGAFVNGKPNGEGVVYKSDGNFSFVQMNNGAPATKPAADIAAAAVQEAQERAQRQQEEVGRAAVKKAEAEIEDLKREETGLPKTYWEVEPPRGDPCYWYVGRGRFHITVTDEAEREREARLTPEQRKAEKDRRDELASSCVRLWEAKAEGRSTADLEAKLKSISVQISRAYEASKQQQREADQAMAALRQKQQAERDAEITRVKAQEDARRAKEASRLEMEEKIRKDRCIAKQRAYNNVPLCGCKVYVPSTAKVCALE